MVVAVTCHTTLHDARTTASLQNLLRGHSFPYAILSADFAANKDWSRKESAPTLIDLRIDRVLLC